MALFGHCAIIEPRVLTPKCGACAEMFANSADLRTHWKTERHLYNMRHRDSGTPMTQEAWEAKLVEQGEGPKSVAGLRSKAEHGIRSAISPLVPAASETASQADPPSCEHIDQIEPLISACDCLFDGQRFGTMAEALAYMERRYSFFIPHREDLVDIRGLLTFLGHKLSRPPHSCICCNRSFPSLASVRNHMVDKGHTHVGTESYSRRGHYDVLGSLFLESELQPFYKCTDVRSVQDVDSVAELATDSDSNGQLQFHQDLEFCLSPPRKEAEELESSSGEELVLQDAMCTYEVDDEAGFEKMMRILDLKSLSPDLNSCGNLQLLGGEHAAHRERWRSHRHARRRCADTTVKYRGTRVSLKELLRSGKAEGCDMEALLVQRKAEQREWVGVLGMTEAQHLRAPRLKASVESKVYDVRSKMNNERGHGCAGQGKRHQNAAVHVQPTKHGGKLAKWSSGPKRKPKANVAQES